jgi:hypothetical protein
MEVLASAAAISVLLFSIAAGLLMLAGVRPPMEIRTESGRSPAEHAFRRHRAVLRQGGLVFILAGGATLAGAIILALVTFVPD